MRPELSVRGGDRGPRWREAAGAFAHETDLPTRRCDGLLVGNDSLRESAERPERNLAI